MATGQSRAVLAHQGIVHVADFCRVEAQQALAGKKSTADGAEE